MTVFLVQPSRPLLLGEAPSRQTQGLPPFSGRSGDSLDRLLGRTWRLRLATANLLGEWPGREGKGSAFPIDAARAAWRLGALRREVDHSIVVLAAGKRVARAIGLPSTVHYFEWHLIPGHHKLCAVVPHPSGVNRWWNDKANRRSAKVWFKRFAL